MALEAILRALDMKAQADIEAVKAEAQERVAEIESEVEREAARTRRQTLKKAEDKIRGEANAIVYSASIKARNELVKAQEEAVDEAFRVAEQRLLSVSEGEGYPGILEALLDECLEYFSGEVVIGVRGEDREPVERMMADRQVPYRISETPLDAAGGLTASSADGEITVLNTLESRLEKARDKLKLVISNALFESRA
ncbi:MAG: V-type proton ATPase subunit E [Actinobacteria bacterium]|nr:V-type proton ATPase subunit E [Actinomycetota bacterium]MBU4240507.1 V-type proton ATPase subunit E [Actinomycetota bacterium]MBU4489617.1 V-type proton ATPase subunit E [Actinomycetota bacterium]